MATAFCGVSYRFGGCVGAILSIEGSNLFRQPLIHGTFLKNYSYFKDKICKILCLTEFKKKQARQNKITWNNWPRVSSSQMHIFIKSCGLNVMVVIFRVFTSKVLMGPLYDNSCVCLSISHSLFSLNVTRHWKKK